MAEIICGIYKITSPTGRIYIGQSIDILRRFEHYYRLNCEGQTKLFNSLKKYTPDFHTFEVVEKCEESDLTEREAFHIYNYNSHSSEGLNCRVPKYKNISGHLCEETKAKMSIAQTGNTKWLGKKHTEETKKKMSASGKGVVRSDEYRQKSSDSRKGKYPFPYEGVHPNAKLVLNLDTGIFYDSLKEASHSYIYNYNLLKQMLNLNSPVKNRTSLIYV